MLRTIGYVALCLVFPIVWGLVVDWAFHRIWNRPRKPNNHNSKRSGNDRYIPDYII